MASNNLSSTEQAGSPYIDNLDLIMSAPENALEPCDLHKDSFDANQFDLVDFGLVGHQSAIDTMGVLDKVPQAADIHATGGVSNPQCVESFANFLQNDFGYLPEAQPFVKNQGAHFNFDFDFHFPLSAATPAPVMPQEMPRYVPFAEPLSSQYMYPPPPDPTTNTPYPYPSMYPYPWAAAPTIPPSFQHDFRNITPPGDQIASLNTSFLMHGSMGPPGVSRIGCKYKPVQDLVYESGSGPEDFALSSTERRRKRRIQTPSLLGDTRISKKAHRATIKNFLIANSNSQQVTKSGNEGQHSDGTISSSLPPSQLAATPPARVAPKASIAGSDADAEADDSDTGYPPNTINAGPRRCKVSTTLFKSRLETIKAQRRAFFQIPQDTSSDLLSPTMQSPLEIQGRRKKHPGRKIKLPQTPEIIARNAARRERYRSSLAPKQRALYDAEKPGPIAATDPSLYTGTEVV
ncbi:MAG: hypothetical protein Q9217_005735 [Psora testacea]